VNLDELFFREIDSKCHDMKNRNITYEESKVPSLFTAKSTASYTKV